MPLTNMPPGSQQDGGESGQPIPGWMLITSVVLVLLSAAIYSVLYLQASAFEEMFKAFGADLPLLTRIVSATYRWYGVLVLVGAIPAYYLIKNRFAYVGDRNELFFLVIAGLGIALILLVLVSVAMYLPVLQVGSVVQ